MVKLLTPQDSPAGSYDFEPGVYEAEFIGYDGPKPSPRFAGQEVIILDFESEDMDYAGNLNRMYSYSMREGGDLYKAVSALAGHNIADDEDVDLDELIGAKVMLTIEENRKTGKNGTEMSFPKIASVTPIRKKAAKPARRPVEPEPEDVDEDTEDDDDLSGTPFQRNR